MRAVLLLGLLVACDDHLMGHGQPITYTCLRDPPLTYESTGKALIARHCLSCHSVYQREALRGGAPPGSDFDTWDDVLAWAEPIVARAVDTDGMPPAATMTADERDLLGEWMRCEVMPALGQVDLQGDGQGEEP
ncbi:MAG: hypothetical protein R3F59_20925 [Myxococcota bacterium]